MTDRRSAGRPRARRVLLLAAAVLTVLAVSSPSVRAQDAPAPTEGQRRLAPVVFVSHLGVRDLPLDATALRHRAGDLLEGILVSSGIGSCDRESVEGLMRLHRIRGPQYLPGAFLAALADSCGTEEALVAHFILFERGMLLLGRITDHGTGMVRAVALAERSLPAGEDLTDLSATRLEEELEALARSFVLDLEKAPRDEGPGEVAMVLPTRTEQRLWAQGQLSTYVVLEGLLAQAGVQVPDPGWISAELLQKGIAPQRIGSQAREILAGDYGVRWLVYPRLVPYEPGRPQTAGFLEDDTAPDLTYLGFRERLLVSLHVARAETGTLQRMNAEYMDQPDVRGAFGVLRRLSWIGRFEKAMAGLVPDLGPVSQLNGVD